MMRFFSTRDTPQDDAPEEARGLGRGISLRLEREINAPAAQAWRVLADEYVDVATWSTTTERSWEMREADLSDGLVPDAAAPVIGRMLLSGRFGEISEVLTLFDAEHMRLRFATGHLPAVLAYAGNTQSVTALGPERCRVCFDIYLVPRGPAWLLSGAFKRVFARGLGRAIDDLVTYVETGRPRSAEA
ncbi:MAG: SRPBCC family protein [Alphaproteobacteria bacterium]|nr:SRPBCC family protein [Alphaproteobacteria bacterium]